MFISYKLQHTVFYLDNIFNF
ncbi:hypothetical protein F383_23107 [Gossypium arboreum]|uniref:Uncharacterized protein n=1 Tax=Gossypium arboreum TaxID=29729 RepID=A0A0B0MLB5_GOSAR|nr:hypothetical protein F383_23107 [Gossypium arboreum]